MLLKSLHNLVLIFPRAMVMNKAQQVRKTLTPFGLDQQGLRMIVKLPCDEGERAISSGPSIRNVGLRTTMRVLDGLWCQLVERNVLLPITTHELEDVRGEGRDGPSKVSIGVNVRRQDKVANWLPAWGSTIPGGRVATASEHAVNCL